MRLKKAEQAEPDGLGNFLGFEKIHDLGDIGLNMRRWVIIKEKNKFKRKRRTSVASFLSLIRPSRVSSSSDDIFSSSLFLIEI
jgi:hypothetical protein